jgi:hypothetical protein
MMTGQEAINTLDNKTSKVQPAVINVVGSNSYNDNIFPKS